ncbi:MAG: hypothetical protein ACKN9S_04090 [Pirellula sp.]
MRSFEVGRMLSAASGTFNQSWNLTSVGDWTSVRREGESVIVSVPIKVYRVSLQVT